MKISCSLLFLSLGLLFCIPEAFTTPWTRVQRKHDKMNNEEIINKDIDTNSDEKVVDGENEITDEKGNKKTGIKVMPKEKRIKTKMSKFEITLVRCCSSNRDRNVERCFEVNGFGGIHFLKMPCKHLDNVLKKSKKMKK